MHVDVMTWESETGRYLARLEALWILVEDVPPHPSAVPYGPLETQPSPLQGVLHRAVVFYELGLWLRMRETLAAVLCLWKEGYLSTVGCLVRLLFELWAACEYQTDAIRNFEKEGNLEKLGRTVNRLFEGVREEVLLPWGQPTLEKPIHVMDTIRYLDSISPGAKGTYNQLCESSHANQPRFLEWWFTGRFGDNWSNPTVQTRGHALIERTVSAAESAIWGTVIAAGAGLERCGKLYIRSSRV